ncbi:hypothetical protein QUA81_11830 [Microcoleus sp. F6_B4]
MIAALKQSKKNAGVGGEYLSDDCFYANLIWRLNKGIGWGNKIWLNTVKLSEKLKRIQQ